MNNLAFCCTNGAKHSNLLFAFFQIGIKRIYNAHTGGSKQNHSQNNSKDNICFQRIRFIAALICKIRHNIVVVFKSSFIIYQIGKESFKVSVFIVIIFCDIRNKQFFSPGFCNRIIAYKCRRN